MATCGWFVIKRLTDPEYSRGERTLYVSTALLQVRVPYAMFRQQTSADREVVDVRLLY